MPKSEEGLYSALTRLHEAETLIKYGVSGDALRDIIKEVTQGIEQYLGQPDCKTDRAVDISQLKDRNLVDIEIYKTSYSGEFGLGICVYRGKKTLVLLKGYKIAKSRDSLSDKWKRIREALVSNDCIGDDDLLTCNVVCFGCSDTGVLSLMYGYPRSLDVPIVLDLYSSK